MRVYPIFFKLRDSGNLEIIEIGRKCLTFSISSVDNYQLINCKLACQGIFHDQRTVYRESRNNRHSQLVQSMITS